MPMWSHKTRVGERLILSKSVNIQIPTQPTKPSIAIEINGELLILSRCGGRVIIRFPRSVERSAAACPTESDSTTADHLDIKA
jgi:hypothetical protein